MLENKKIGVIGCGNMASAIVRGFHKKFSNLTFLTYTPSKVRAIELAREVNGESTSNLSDFNSCDILLIGCKPQQFDDLAKDLNGKIINQDIHIVSMLAAIDLGTLSKKLNSTIVTRIMPNTPILMGDGVTLMTHSKEVDNDMRFYIEKLFESVGKLYLINDETSFDQMMTVTGCGPAYVFLFAQTLITQLISWGIDEKSAKEMTVNMISGSVAMMKECPDDLNSLISQVTSKGGTTIEAVNIFKENKLDLISSKALEAAFNRSQILRKEFSK